MMDADGVGRLRTFVAAQPVTLSQRERYARILGAATEMLRSGGADALQMTELADAAQVSFTSLYRYFPSKDHVVLAIAACRYETAFSLRGAAKYPGATPAERVAYFLRRSFNGEQAEPSLSAAMHGVLASSDPALAITVMHVKELIRGHLVSAAGPFSNQQKLSLPVVLDISAAASRESLSGRIDMEYAALMILLGCRLLDLDETVIDADRNAAQSWKPFDRRGKEAEMFVALGLPVGDTALSRGGNGVA